MMELGFAILVGIGNRGTGNPWELIGFSLVFLGSASVGFFGSALLARTAIGTGTGEYFLREDEILVRVWDALNERGIPLPAAAAEWRPAPEWLRRWAHWWPWLDDAAGYVQRVRQRLPRRQTQFWRTLLFGLGVWAGFFAWVKFTVAGLLRLDLSSWPALWVHVYAGCFRATSSGSLGGMALFVVVLFLDLFLGGGRRDRLLVDCWDALQAADARDERANPQSAPKRS